MTALWKSTAKDGKLLATRHSVHKSYFGQRVSCKCFFSFFGAMAKNCFNFFQLHVQINKKKSKSGWGFLFLYFCWTSWKFLQFFLRKQQNKKQSVECLKVQLETWSGCVYFFRTNSITDFHLLWTFSLTRNDTLWLWRLKKLSPKILLSKMMTFS